MARSIRLRTCTRKRKYLTLEEAQGYAKTYSQYVYRCPYCGWLHLTKQKPRRAIRSDLRGGLDS